MTLPPIDIVALRARSFGFSFALWMFGFCTTVLLIGLWGRSVATDDTTLAESANAVLRSEIVNERVLDWIGDGVTALSGAASEDTKDAVDRIGSSAEMQRVLEDLVDQAVRAALAKPGTASAIDLSSSVEVLTPVVIDTLRQEGIEADATQVRDSLLEAPALILSSEDRGLVSESVQAAARLLTWVVVVGLTGLVLTGAIVILMADDRVRQIRALAIRLGVSAISFALILRVGAWAVDPRRGRSPISDGGAVLLASNGHVLVYVGAAAALLVGGTSFVLVRARRNAARQGPAAEEAGGSDSGDSIEDTEPRAHTAELDVVGV